MVLVPELLLIPEVLCPRLVPPFPHPISSPSPSKFGLGILLGPSTAPSHSVINTFSLTTRLFSHEQQDPSPNLWSLAQGLAHSRCSLQALVALTQEKWGGCGHGGRPIPIPGGELADSFLPLRTLVLLS